MKNLILIVTKKITLLFFIFAPYSINAQEYFIPSKGKIAFEQKQRIIDQKLYDSTLTEFNNLFQKSLKRHIISENKNIDEALLEMLLSQSTLPANDPFSISKDVVNYQHDFKDSIIIVTKNVNNKIRRDYMFLNRNSNTYDIKAKIDLSRILIKNKPHQYKVEEDIIIKDYRNITKIINGYVCFKVILTLNHPEDELITKLNKSKTIYELYVTEEIKCNYHPVINYKSIIENYYPLEIKEYNSIVEGIEKISILKEFTLM